MTAGTLSVTVNAKTALAMRPLPGKETADSLLSVFGVLEPPYTRWSCDLGCGFGIRFFP